MFKLISNVFDFYRLLNIKDYSIKFQKLPLNTDKHFM